MSVTPVAEDLELDQEPTSFRDYCSMLWQRYRGVALWLVLLQVLTFSYFFFALLWTDHTLPNSELQVPYPTFKTQGEGRWFADIIIQLQGGTGVQAFQMFLAAVFQSINGILFARFAGIRRPLEVALVGSFVCIYPALLDHYATVIDHLTFAFGDTLALAGILVFKANPRSVRNLLVTVVLFVLCLAAYQPKIGLMGLLCLLQVIQGILDRPTSGFSLKRTALEAANVVLALCAATLVYFVSTRLTLTYDIGSHAHVNSIPEAIGQATASFGKFVQYNSYGADYMPSSMRFLPFFGLFWGVSATLLRAYRIRPVAALVVMAVLPLLPIALMATNVINMYSIPGSGRMVFVYGYTLLFFLCKGLQLPPLKKLISGVLVLFVYFFVVAGTQESSAVAHKSFYEMKMINRVLARIETVTPDLYQSRHGLAIFGYLPPFPRERFVRNPNLYNRGQGQAPTFQEYRQTNILNHLLGADALYMPTAEQMAGAVESVRNRKPWPAAESVYVHGDVVVVLLEEYRDDLPRTWTTPR